MLERMTCGELPPKHHLALRGPSGALCYEECLTRSGFEGPYSILYHLQRPQALEVSAAEPVRVGPNAGEERLLGLRRRHFRSGTLERAGTLAHGRVPLLYNADLTLGVAKPTESDASYFINADADELLFVRRGRGTVRSPLGDLSFGALEYVFLPKGLLYRLELAPAEPQEYLSIECKRGLDLPRQFRNEVGQLRMDAPYCHRDFRRPVFQGPLDEGIRALLVKRDDALHAVHIAHSPLDVLGWDGTVYPWVFPILAFQPRVSSVHLPPTWHGTFAAGGALICSFVPRPVDFHPDAIPCPYPHASVDIDEVLFYVSGDFASRTGVGPASLTLHPRGIPHGPQPGKYEASLGATRTEELAVMLDCALPLRATPEACAAEDPNYEKSFAGVPTG